MLQVFSLSFYPCSTPPLFLQDPQNNNNRGKNINCIIYWISIYNPGPQYAIGWHTYIGMTTKPDYCTRIKEHKMEAKPYNIKFDTIRKQSNTPWKYGIVKQWQKPFTNSDQGLAFMAKYEQYYIKKYKTYNTIYGLNNSIGGDYGGYAPNTSGIKYVSLNKKKQLWSFVDPSSLHESVKYLCHNRNLLLLLYQAHDQFKQTIEIINEQNYKKSLEINSKMKPSLRKAYYCGAPNISITKSKNKQLYRWQGNQDKKNFHRNNTFDFIDELERRGMQIYTPILFAYQAIGLENEWLTKNYTVNQSKFMSFNEFKENYTIKDNNELRKVIKDNIVSEGQQR